MRYFVGIERFLGIAFIGDSIKLVKGGVRKGLILRLRESSRFNFFVIVSRFVVVDRWLS